MRKPLRIGGLIVLGLLLAAAGAARLACFSLKLDSNSMQPLVNGSTTVASKDGDTVVGTKWFCESWIRTGDLVVADIPTPGGRIRTVRRVEQQADTPVGWFYLRAMSTNGYDSRQFGPLPSTNIKAKVLWVSRGH